jgi:hypothetical protein
MIYKLDIVEIDLEKFRGTGLSSDHGGVASLLFSEGGKLIWGYRHT